MRSKMKVSTDGKDKVFIQVGEHFGVSLSPEDAEKLANKTLDAVKSLQLSENPKNRERVRRR